MAGTNDGETENQGDDVEGDLEGREEVDPFERRLEPRHLACFPAHIETPEGVPRSALIRDLSLSGALLLTRAKLRVGDAVKLSLHLREGGVPFATTGHVVREERRPSEMAHPWSRALAVHFTTPITEIEVDVKALAERQAAIGGRPRSSPPVPSSRRVAHGEGTRLPTPPPPAGGPSSPSK